MLQRLEGRVNASFQLIHQPLDRDALLLHGVTVAHRDRLILHRLMVDRDAVRRADLVLAAITAADGAGLVILDRKVPRQAVTDLQGLLRLSGLIKTRVGEDGQKAVQGIFKFACSLNGIEPFRKPIGSAPEPW